MHKKYINTTLPLHKLIHMRYMPEIAGNCFNLCTATMVLVLPWVGSITLTNSLLLHMVADNMTVSHGTLPNFL